MQVVPLLACVDLLHAWRSYLAANVPCWAQSLVFWCKNLSHTPGQLAVLARCLVLDGARRRRDQLLGRGLTT